MKKCKCIMGATALTVLSFVVVGLTVLGIDWAIHNMEKELIIDVLMYLFVLFISVSVWFVFYCKCVDWYNKKKQQQLIDARWKKEFNKRI